MKVEGRVAVVTGGGGGIGGAIAAGLVERGARVVVADLDEHAAQRVVTALREKTPGSAVAVAADVSDDEHIRGLVERAEAEFGPVDLYFANAGVTGVPGLEIEDSVWEQSFDVNLRAHIRAARLLVPRWVERGEGYFVSTASAAGLLTQIGSATYSVTKHAAVGFAEWLSVTYGDKGVRVSCLCRWASTHLCCTRGTHPGTRSVNSPPGPSRPPVRCSNPRTSRRRCSPRWRRSIS